LTTCVVGAGAIGGLVAARLALSGQPVSVVARGDNLAAIRTGGLTLVSPDGTRSVATGIVASDDVEALGPHDVVVLAVKAHQLAAVAPSLRALYDDDTVVVALQNGIPWWFFQRFAGPYDNHTLTTLDPDGVLDRSIEVQRIVGCIAYPAAERIAPGTFLFVEGDTLPVGELDGARTDRVARIAESFSTAGFRSRVLTDLRAHLFVKAWGNLAFNPISALTRATLVEMCDDPATRRVASDMMREGQAVATKLGLRLRISVEQRIEGARAVGAHKTSMLQDVEAGRELEIDALVGAFLELGALTDTPMPVTTVVHALVSMLNDQLARRELP
jgi:2-dehydropantoate 2-reductase